MPDLFCFQCTQNSYTLHCVGYAGANPPSIDKSVIVNIIPSFIEK